MDCEYAGDVSGLECALSRMTEAVCGLLVGCRPSVYLYGSAVSGDFRLGWSDLDVLVLTREPIPRSAAEALVSLRQTMTAAEPDNVYYRLFEGGMLPLRNLLSGEPTRAVYWGTSGQRLTDGYALDAFGRLQLRGQGRLLAGEELRGLLPPPSYAELRDAVAAHLKAVRRYAAVTGRSLYSFGWMLDVARGLYTIRTGRVASKTDAGRWALQNALCPDPELLETALCVREAPLRLRDDPRTLDLAESLGDAVQRSRTYWKKRCGSAPPPARAQTARVLAAGPVRLRCWNRRAGGETASPEKTRFGCPTGVCSMQSPARRFSSSAR